MDEGRVQSLPSAGLKRKPKCLNHDGGGSASVGVDGIRWDSVKVTLREEKREPRKGSKLQQEQLVKVPDRGVRACRSYAHHSRSDNGGSDGKELTSETGATCIPTEASRVVNAGKTRLAQQPNVRVSTDRLSRTPDAAIAAKEKQSPIANRLYLKTGFVCGMDKMEPPEKLTSKAGVVTKRGAPGKVESPRDAKRAKVESARSKRMADIMKQCGTLLKTLMSRKNASVFNKPVDAVKLGLHDYHRVIKKPMDLGTVKKKLNGGIYTTPIEFAEDVRLTFKNAMTYNPTGHEVYVMANGLCAFFEERSKNIEEKMDEDRLKVEVEDEPLAIEGQGQSENYQVKDLKQRIRSIEDRLQSLAKRPTGGRRAAQPKPKSNDVEKRPMTFDEKRKLKVSLENVNLLSDKSEHILQIIKKRNPTVSRSVEELEIEVDVYSLDDDTLWDLDRFVTNCAKSRGVVKKKVPLRKPLARAVQDGAQLSPDNGAGKSPKRTRIGGEVEEKDMHIDDDVAQPQLQCQQNIVIEKEADESSSPSSSSSDSSSSLRRSDSGSSSGSDSGSSARGSDSASSSANNSDAEEAECVEVIQKGSPAALAAEPEVPKALESREVEDVWVTVEEAAPVKPAPTRQQDDPREKILPEREVFTEKLRRAALLKGRFADTILKAQEKLFSLKKNEKVEPADREELEKMQREEKARLHAEAKAAEFACRRAEVEATDEAKRKRDAEREAARIELHKMRRTVEIPENKEVLKDLETLRSKALESSGATPQSDTSGGLYSFSLQGGNPLHRLGLYIKEDDDEGDESHGR